MSLRPVTVTRFAILGYALLSCAPAAAPAPPAQTLPTSELGAITQAMVDAIAPGNVAVWDRYLDPAFLYVTEDDEVKSRAATLADLKPLPPGFTGSARVVDLAIVSAPGDPVAVTTYVIAETEDIEGQVFHGRFRQTDTWRRAGGQWKLLAAHVMAINRDPPAIAVPAATLDQYVGSYARSATAALTLRREGDHLVLDRGPKRPPQILRPETPDVFFSPGKPRTRQIFQRAADGAVRGFVERREGEDLRWTRR